MTVALVWWSGAALLAYTIKGFSGFGPALVVLPTLSTLYDPRTALAASAMIDLAVGLILFLSWRAYPEERRLLYRLCIYIAAGTLVGALLAGVLPRTALLVLIGVTVVGLAIRLALSGSTALPSSVVGRSLPLAGVVAGLSGGLVGISGPFVVAGTAHFDKSAMRRLLVGVFLVENVVKLIVYSFNGVVSVKSLDLSMIAIPSIAIGLAVGAWLHNRVSQRAFLRILAAILLIAGAQPLVEALR